MYAESSEMLKSSTENAFLVMLEVRAQASLILLLEKVAVPAKSLREGNAGSIGRCWDDG